MTSERTGTLQGQGLRSAARTDCGRQRRENEDRYLLDPDRGIFLVVDGVGGHAAGEVAARIAHDTIQKRLERQDAAADVRVREAITLANQQILLHAQESPARKGMACVLTLALLEGRRLTVGHVGDTRLYRLSPDAIAKMTHDHSPVGEREDAREISETEAMQHARRNEVYRDVGSEPREPDAADFIEMVVSTVDDDVAVLLCSDGLSDMLPSLEIDRIVRRHAGDPAAVADALVDAANEAGGRDNITVLYAEGPRFAASSAGGRVLPMARQDAPQVATEALDVFPVGGGGSESAGPETPAGATDRSAPPPRRGAGSRGRWLTLAAGVLLGSAAAVGLMRLSWPPSWRLTSSATATPRELTVGGTAAGSFRTIGDALLQAREGDVIRVHAGRYAEAVELRRGVTLLSDSPQGAVLVAPSHQKAWASVTVWGEQTALRGFRITNEGTPGHVGVRVHPGGIEIEDVVFEGPMELALDAAGRGSRAVVRGSRFTGIGGVPVQIGEGASVTLRQNLFRAAPGTNGPAVACVSPDSVTLDANLFMHFAGPPVVAATGAAIVIDPAYVIPRPPAPKGRAR